MHQVFQLFFLMIVGFKLCFNRTNNSCLGNDFVCACVGDGVGGVCVWGGVGWGCVGVCLCVQRMGI